MRAGSAIVSSVRHTIGVGLQALLIAAIVAGLAFAGSAVFGSAPGGAYDVFAAKPVSGRITVAGPVAHGGSTTATVNPGGTDVYVFVQCYAADGAYVYAAYSPVSAEKTASIGPLTSPVWAGGGANCTAQEGYFTRNGFGKWVVSAATEFTVNP